MIKHYKDTSFSNNIKSIKYDNNIKFLQHNCMKLTNVMQSCLEYATINKYDIVLLQESWVREKKIILHSKFICIILKVLNYRARVIIFVIKTNRKLVYISRVNIINDSDC